MNKLGRQLNLCRRRLKLFLWLLALFILTACRKEPTTWDIQAKVPIAHTIIKATNLMSDSLISENADGYLSLVYTPQLLSIQKLEAFSFPDSLLTYNLPITVSGTLNPNTIFCNYNQLLNLKVNSAALTQAQMSSGILDLTCNNPLDQDAILELTIPKASHNGQTLSIKYRIKPSQTPQHCQINMADYVFDLKGPQGNKSNLLQVKIVIKTAEDVDVAHFVQGTEVQLNLKFKDLKIKYIQGYFGTLSQYVGQESLSLDLFRKLSSSDFQIEKVKAQLRIDHQIGCDLQLKIKELAAKNTQSGSKVNFTAPFIGQNINISRAICLQKNPLKIQKTTQTIDLSNTNLKNLIQILPNQISYNIDMKLNPLGNVTSYHDFMYNGYGLNVFLDLDIPLALKTKALYYTDTLDYDLSSMNALHQSQLYLICQNKFPVSIQVELFILNDSTGQKTQILLSQDLISGGKYNASAQVENGAVESILSATLDEAAMVCLKTHRKLILLAKFNTEHLDQYVKFKATDALSVSLSGNFNYMVEVGR